MPDNPQVSRLADSDMSSAQASHVLRVLGLVGTAEEMYGIQAVLVAGGDPAKRLLATKLESIILALSDFCGLTVTTGGVSAASSYDGGTYVNAIAAIVADEDRADDDSGLRN